VHEVLRVTAEKERIGTELHMAAQIQESMLPHLFPPFPDRKEFDLYASMNPAREVGGDFYDFFLIDDDHLCLVMADVSGKGVPGALFMMISKVILQSCAMLGQGVSEILTKTNEALCSNNKVEMFVTVWLGVLEISTGKIIAANAGHEFPAIYRKDGAFQLYKDKHGFVVGGMEGIRYKEYELQMNPGDKLFLYTDGVPEATDANKKMFGTERMIAALNEHVDRSPKEILHGVRQAVDAFVGDEEQFDDLTMLCLEYRGAQGFSVTRADPG
jgi:sigma-B regulation protein RsbU (phosphoserine phosphatase)